MRIAGVRFECEMHPATHAWLTERARIEGRPMGDVMAEALGFWKFFHAERAKGNRVLIERAGHVQEVVGMMGVER